LPLLQQPLLQLLPGQQGSPTVPHSAHSPVDDVELQIVPAAQRSVPLLPLQQVWPAAPHAEQMLLLHTRPAWQVLVPQHGWPEAPQPAHFPAAQTPGLVPVLPPVPAVAIPQAWASATQVSL